MLIALILAALWLIAGVIITHAFLWPEINPKLSGNPFVIVATWLGCVLFAWPRVIWILAFGDGE